MKSRFLLHSVAWVALLAATDVAAQSGASSPQAGSIALEDAPAVLEVDGAPGSVAGTLRRASVLDLAFAASRLSAAEIHSPGPLTDRERLSLASTLTAGERLKVGIARAYAVPAGFDLSTTKAVPAAGDRLGGGLFVTKAGRKVWTAGFSSPGAGAVRLRLDDVALPAGTMAYVYNRHGEVHGPYALGGAMSGPLWTNTLFSAEAFLEIQFPAGWTSPSSERLSVAAIAHIEQEQFAPSVATPESSEALATCFKDASCVGESELAGLDNAERAVAQMLFESEGSLFVCSGALVNTTEGNATPYFLTANHCVSTAASAWSLELFWDKRTTTCGGSVASGSSVQRTLGATILATGSVQQGEPDFTLLQLSQSPPSGRFYLGWSAAADALVGGTKLYRISHPEGGPQMFSRHAVSAVPTPGECPNLPQGRFAYSKNEIGATKGGSSGAPAFVADGLKIVGQLYGRCGQNITDTCDATANSAVDGAFASYFPRVRRWLAPASAAACTPSDETLCLLGSRFKVELTGRDPRTGKIAPGQASADGDKFGYFSLPALTGQADNPEVFVKILDGRAISGKYWVFWGGLTDLEFTLTVTDSVTGAVKTYMKQPGSFCGDADTQAF